MRASRVFPTGPSFKAGGFHEKTSPFEIVFRRALPLTALLLLLTGCAGYRLGPTGGIEAGEKSIQVNLFENYTSEPRLIEEVATSIRREVQRDGTFKLDTHGNGDWIVNGVLSDFRLDGLSFQRGDVLTVKDYRATLVADITVTERFTGNTNLSTTLNGYTTLRFEGDLGNAIRLAVPQMADDISRKLVLQLADGTWE